jgi:hypothetical protein
MQGVALGKKNTKKATKATRPTDAWLPNAMIVCIGGMAYTIAAQWLMQLGGAYWEDGHLVDPDVKLWLMVPAVMLFIYAYFARNGGFNRAESTMPNSSHISQVRSYDDGSSSTVSLLIVLFIGLVIAAGFLTVPATWTIAIGVLTGLGIFCLALLYLIYPTPLARTYTVLTWLLGYVTLWVLSATVSHVSIWMFALVWIVIGALGGNTVSIAIRRASVIERETSGHVWRQKNVEPETIKQSRRARMTSAVVSQYGRIPQDTFDLLNQHVRRVTGPVAASIPLSASEQARNITIREILDVTLRDWRENDNLKGLQPVDIDDLRSFIDASLAVSGLENDPVTLAIYKISLRALLQDWLDNWNVEGHSGAPLRNYR